MHDPGRIIVDLAVCVALGGGCLSDLAVLLRLMTTWDSSPARAVLSAHSPPPFGQDIHSRLTSVRVWILTSTLVCDALWPRDCRRSILPPSRWMSDSCS